MMVPEIATVFVVISWNMACPGMANFKAHVLFPFKGPLVFGLCDGRGVEVEGVKRVHSQGGV
jgi:hypothetical protein